MPPETRYARNGAVLPGTTHVGVTRRPAEVLALITPFLDAR